MTIDPNTPALQCIYFLIGVEPSSKRNIYTPTQSDACTVKSQPRDINCKTSSTQ